MECLVILDLMKLHILQGKEIHHNDIAHYDYFLCNEFHFLYEIRHSTFHVYKYKAIIICYRVPCHFRVNEVACTTTYSLCHMDLEREKIHSIDGFTHSLPRVPCSVDHFDHIQFIMTSLVGNFCCQCIG